MIEIHRGKFNEAKLTRSIMHQDRKWENSAKIIIFLLGFPH